MSKTGSYVISKIKIVLIKRQHFNLVKTDLLQIY